MKKAYLISLGLITGGLSLAQTGTADLDTNNVHAVIGTSGELINGYYVPKDLDVNGIHELNWFVGGTDINGQYFGAIALDNQSDFAPGPVAGAYTDSSYINKYGDGVWTVTRSEINEFLQHWSDPNYEIPASILTWPGNGNPLNDEDFFLAPFYDRSQDSIYNPHDGDYPLFCGDKVVYSIFSDKQFVHPSGLNIIGVEVHVMASQFDNFDPILGNTTFFSVKCINRSTRTLFDPHINAIIDFDLGNPQDDYVGCDSTLGLSYVYNGDAMDEDNLGVNGYGYHPPALGLVSLNRPLFMSVPVYDLSNVNSIANTMRGAQSTGAPFLNGQGDPTHFLWSDTLSNGFNEFALGNTPGDRRVATGWNSEIMGPGAAYTFDFAMIYARSEENNLFASVDSLMQVAAYVKALYDNGELCAFENLVLSELEQPVLEMYPNPANTQLMLKNATSGTIIIQTLDGKEVLNEKLNQSFIDVSTLAAGSYVVTILENGSRKVGKLMVSH